MAMKKGGKKYIIYVVSNSYVNSHFYLKVVCKHKCFADSQSSIRNIIMEKSHDGF